MPLAAKRGHSRLWDMIFAILTLEIGLFLLIYPWMDSWNLNHFPAQLRNYIHNYNPFGFSLEDLWDDPFFRGAVSGLGLVNLWICVREVVRLVRPSH